MFLFCSGSTDITQQERVAEIREVAVDDSLKIFGSLFQLKRRATGKLLQVFSEHEVNAAVSFCGCLRCS